MKEKKQSREDKRLKSGVAHVPSQRVVFLDQIAQTVWADSLCVGLHKTVVVIVGLDFHQKSILLTLYAEVFTTARMTQCRDKNHCLFLCF